MALGGGHHRLSIAALTRAWFVRWLFDLFETLITESRFPPTRASRLGETLGCEEKAFRAAWKARRPRVVVGQLSFAGALAEISTALTGTVDTAAIERICQQRGREKAAVYARIDEQVTALIAGLQGRGISLAVVSNCFEADVLAWPSCSLAGYFQCTVFSFSEGVAKPDPEIYLRAVRRLGVSPAATAFIGDGADHELDGAARAGLRAFRAAWFARESPGSRSSEAMGLDLADQQDVLKLVAAG